MNHELQQEHYDNNKKMYDYILPGHSYSLIWDEIWIKSKGWVEIHITFIDGFIKLNGRDHLSDYEEEFEFIEKDHYFDKSYNLSDPDSLDAVKKFCADLRAKHEQ